jgi:type II secretory pathway component PulC
LFLIFWLLICASAGAAGAIGNQFSAELHQSTYQPVKQRDPFFKIRSPVHEVKSLPSTVVGLQLDGILYQPTDPSAIVNGQLVTLHKIVSLNTGAEEFQVKAIEITRDHVVLEANGRRVELNLSSKNSFGSPPP